MIKQEAKYYEAFTITEEMEISIVASIKSNYRQIQAVTWERVRSATKEDPYMRILSDTIINGFPNEASCLPPQLQPYWQQKDNLSIMDEVIMKQDYRTTITSSINLHHSSFFPSRHISNVREAKENSLLARDILKHILNTRGKSNTCLEIAPS